MLDVAINLGVGIAAVFLPILAVFLFYTKVERVPTEKYASTKYETNSREAKLWTELELALDTAFVALSVVAIIQVLQVSELDIPLTISIYAFATTIPLQAVMVVIARQMKYFKYDFYWGWGRQYPDSLVY